MITQLPDSVKGYLPGHAQENYIEARDCAAKQKDDDGVKNWLVRIRVPGFS